MSNFIVEGEIFVLSLFYNCVCIQNLQLKRL